MADRSPDSGPFDADPGREQRLRRDRLATSGDAAPSWMPTAVAAFLLLGCVLRIVRYAQNLPLWSDECFLAVNFINRGYLELLQPLDNGQIAPLLYLWVERLVIDLAGFSEWSLRLFPLLCGLGSMVLFWRLARRCVRLQPRSVLAGGRDLRGQRASDSPCRRGEALCVRSAGRPLAAGPRRRVAATARSDRLALGSRRAVAPLALLLSNPAVFVAAGIGLGLLVPVWRTGRWPPRLAVCCLALATLARLRGDLRGLRPGAERRGHRGPETILGLVLSALARSRSSGGLAGLRSHRTVFAYPGGGAQGASHGDLRRIPRSGPSCWSGGATGRWSPA